MSDVEKIEAEYRALATKLIYDGFEGEVDPDEQTRLEQLGEELTRLNAAGASVQAEDKVFA